MHVRNDLLVTDFKRWAIANYVPYYNPLEWDNLTVTTFRFGVRIKKTDVTLPTEYIREEYMGNITHHIKPCPLSEMKTAMTEYDRDMVTTIVGLYEIHGLGLNQPPEKNEYFQFLRAGGAYLRIYEDQLQCMIYRQLVFSILILQSQQCQNPRS